MDYKLKRVMSKIENGNIQSAHIYELVDTYYQCVIYKLKTDTLAAFCSLGASAPFSG